MALPTAQYWTKMTPVTPASTSVSDWLDTLHSALTAATDYLGAAVPANHIWTATKIVPTAVTEALDIRPPGASTFVGALCVAGYTGAKTPKLWTPDTWLSKSPIVCFTADSSPVLTTWDDTNGPWGATKYTPGYWRFGPATDAAAAGNILVYLSDEKIAVQWKNGSNHYFFCGPGLYTALSESVSNTELNGRVWGLMTGTPVLTVSWSNYSATRAFSYASTAAGNHVGYKIPRSSSAGAVALSLICEGSASTGVQLDGNSVSVATWYSDFTTGAFIGSLRDFRLGQNALAGEVKTDGSGRKWFAFGGYSSTVVGNSWWLPGVL